MSEHKAQAAARKHKTRKPIPKRGRRGKDWVKVSRWMREDAIGFRCPVCLLHMGDVRDMQVAHLIPRSLAPDLALDVHNLVVVCAEHDQPEDKVGDSRSRLAILRDRYGADRAEWAEQQMRARGLIKEWLT